MIELITIVGVIVSIITVVHSVRTLIETRRQYYEDYLRRKHSGKVEQ